MAYRSRVFGENPLYKTLSDHWNNFLGSYEERFQHTCGVLRGITERVVERFLDCGNPMNGFARIKCSDCGCGATAAFQLRDARVLPQLPGAPLGRMVEMVRRDTFRTGSASPDRLYHPQDAAGVFPA